MTNYRLTDLVGLFQVGVPKDLGWAVATMHEDMTITRRCKGCGIESRDPINPETKYVRAIFHHTAACPVMARLEAVGGEGGTVLS